MLVLLIVLLAAVLLALRDRLAARSLELDRAIRDASPPAVLSDFEKLAWR